MLALVLALSAGSPPRTQTPPVDRTIQTDVPAPTVDAADVVIPDGVIGTAERTTAPGDTTISGTVVITK